MQEIFSCIDYCRSGILKRGRFLPMWEKSRAKQKFNDSCNFLWVLGSTEGKNNLCLEAGIKSLKPQVCFTEVLSDMFNVTF